LYVEGLHEIPEGAVKGGGKYARDIYELFASYFQGSAVKYKYVSRTYLFTDLRRTLKYKIS
jgi:hypothetical protein